MKLRTMLIAGVALALLGAAPDYSIPKRQWYALFAAPTAHCGVAHEAPQDVVMVIRDKGHLSEVQVKKNPNDPNDMMVVITDTTMDTYFVWFTRLEACRFILQREIDTGRIPNPKDLE